MSWNLKCENHFIRNRDDLQNSNLICLPENILAEIKNIEPPYLFQLINPITNLKTYVGVKEFHEQINPSAILPYWVYEYLGCTNTTILHIQLLGPILPGKQITIQPLENSFFDIKDYDKCLEQLLINYPVIHKDQILRFLIFNKNYDVLITDVQPDLNFIENLNEKSIDPFNIIRIININLNLVIDNKFLRKELEAEKETKAKEIILPNNEKNEIKGVKLGTNIKKKLTREEIRLQRIKTLEKKK